ncbi:MAG: hypothetical protein Q9M19_07565 [Mariprofundaceae bacterium]|nr:hypothetical protein [Mariprofundaceae bacterium]
MKWNKYDVIFITVVVAVIVVLVLGTTERTTKAVPNDAMHIQATSRAACMACHGVDSDKPQPIGHPSSSKCFQCHTQPQDWKVAKP